MYIMDVILTVIPTVMTLVIMHFVSPSSLTLGVLNEENSCECLFSSVITLNPCHVLGQVPLGIRSSCSHGGCNTTGAEGSA